MAPCLVLVAESVQGRDVTGASGRHFAALFRDSCDEVESAYAPG